MDGLMQDIFSVTPGVFIDAGMNIGQTLLKVAAFTRGNSYMGFEPNPACFYCCSKIIELNRLEHFQIYPVGLFSENKVEALYIDNDYSSGATVIKDFRNKARFSRSHNVVLLKGDDIVEKEKPASIAIIKLDIEGAELEAIMGFAETIKKYKPFIIAEILPVYDTANENGLIRKSREEQLLALLFTAGYKLYRIANSGNTLHPLEEIPTHGNMKFTNYLFVHQEKMSLLNKFRFYGIASD